MSDKVFYSQPAYILHYQHYRETSLIIEALTRDFGRVSLIAKGVRKTKSKTVGLLRPFKPLCLSFMGNSGLKIITQIEAADLPGELTGMALYCGYYVNELIGHFLHKDDPYPELFQHYQECLINLSGREVYEPALRIFELYLMDAIGYGLNLGYDYHSEKPIESNKKYLFNKDGGFIEDRNGQFSGNTLLAMQQKKFDDPKVMNEAKFLMRIVIDHHLQGKQLKSRSVINNIFKRL